MKHIEVVAAVIVRDGRYFATQRGYGEYKDKWEFPGGKVEPGETPAGALERECREELDVRVAVGPLYAAVTHEYPDLTIRLSLYCARIEEGVPRLLEHTDLRWITPEKIPQYAFCPADESILKTIEREGLPA